MKLFLHTLFIIIIIILPVYGFDGKTSLIPVDKYSYSKCIEYYVNFKNGDIDSSSIRKIETKIFNDSGLIIEQLSYGNFNYIRQKTNWYYYKTYYEEMDSMFESSEKLIKSQSKLYNNDGLIKEFKTYDSNNILNSQITCFYDKNNNEIKRCTLENGILISTLSTTYDDQGNKIYEEQISGNGKIIWQVQRRYDKKRNLIEYFSGENGIFQNKSYIKMDSIDKISEEITFDSNNNIISKTSYEFNQNENYTNRIVEIGYNNGAIFRDYFDNNGKVIKTISFNKNAESERTTFYKYDESGRNLEHKILNIDGSIYFKQTNTFNNYGNLMETIYYNKENLPESKYFYIYSK